MISTLSGPGGLGFVASLARPLVLIGGTVSLAANAIGMFAYRQSVLDSAFSVNSTVYSLDALSGLLTYGFVAVLIGVAIVGTGRFPRWLGWLAVSGGLLEIVLQAVALMPGVSIDLASIDYLASTLIVLAIVGAGLHMLLRPAQLAKAHEPAIA